jgi:hypothetical protein
LAATGRIACRNSHFPRCLPRILRFKSAKL